MTLKTEESETKRRLNQQNRRKAALRSPLLSEQRTIYVRSDVCGVDPERNSTLGPQSHGQRTEPRLDSGMCSRGNPAISQNRELSLNLSTFR
jgi:hypothetical protein